MTLMTASDPALWGLFLSAFVSASLFPGGSEVLLFALAAEGSRDPASLLVTATLGNTLGGMSSWLLGRVLAWRFPHRPLLKGQRHRAAWRAMRRWVAPILLFSWLPVIGDPLCVVAGWLRTALWSTVFFVAVGKLLRYGVILYLA